MDKKLNVSFRIATRDDIVTIQNLNEELGNYIQKLKGNKFDKDETIKEWSFSKKARGYFLYLIYEQFVYLAEVDGEVVGYAMGEIYSQDSLTTFNGKSAELYNIFIKEKYRGLGIGKQLETAFLNWCKKNAVSRIFVNVEIENKAAIDFYKNNNYFENQISLCKKIK